MKIEVSHRFGIEITRLVKNSLKLTRERHENCNKNYYNLYESDNQSFKQVFESEVKKYDFDHPIKNFDEILTGYFGNKSL